MKRYKNYYIDNVIFHNEAEIDAHIKNEHIRHICKIHSLVFGAAGTRYTPDEIHAAMADIAVHEQALHDTYNMSWEEIEEIPYTQEV